MLEAPTPPGSTRGPRRSRAPLLIALVAVLAGGALAAWLTTNRGPSLLGPTEGGVGDEVAFAVPEAIVERWSVGGRTSSDPVLLFTPRSEGLVAIEVTTEDGTASLEFRAEERGSALAIEGPGLLPVGERSELSLTGDDGSGAAWTINGEPHDQATVVLRPATAGLVRVSVTTDAGEEIERTLTAAPAATP